MTKHFYIYSLFTIMGLMQIQALAQEKFLYVSVINTNKSAVSGILITCTQGCSTELVNQGTAKIALPLQTHPNDTIILRLVNRSSRNPEWIIVSPPGGVVSVPSFSSRNAVPVMVALKGSNQALGSTKTTKVIINKAGRVINDRDIKAIVEKTLKATKAQDGQVSEQEFDLALQMQAKAYGLTPEEVIRAIHEWAERAKDPYDKGIAALFDKKYAEATKLLTTSYELRKKNAEEFADVAYFLGQSLWQQGRYREAAEKLQEAVVFRKDDLDVLIGLGLSLDYSGKHSEAEIVYRRALAISEQKFGRSSPQTAVILNNLGLVCRLQRKLTEAETLYKEALAINKKELGNEDPLTANSLNNLAQLRRDQGKYDEAELLYKEALTIREKKLGKDHPDTAITMDNLGLLYVLQGRYEEAEPLLKYALTVKEKTLGNEHPITANSYGNVGMLYYNQGKYIEAVTILEKELAIREKQGDENELVDSYNTIGVAYHRQGKYAEAERYYKQALNMCAKRNPDECAMTIRNLGKLYTAQGKYAEAEPLFLRALTIFEKGSSREPFIRVVFVLESYAELLRKTNREEEANTLENLAKELRAKAKFYGKN